MDIHFVYIIESIRTGKWYYGYTTDLVQRLQFHNEGSNVSTKNGCPWRYIFVRKFDSKREALQFELYLKKMRNKEFLLRKFKDYFLTDWMITKGCTPTRRGRLAHHVRDVGVAPIHRGNHLTPTKSRQYLGGFLFYWSSFCITHRVRDVGVAPMHRGNHLTPTKATSI